MFRNAFIATLLVLGACTTILDEDEDGIEAAFDCNDADASAGLPIERPADADGDGYGDPVATVAWCPGDQGAADTTDDCDDAVAEVNPSATEVCDDIDNNCDGFIDDPTSADAGTWYLDADGDGFGGDIYAEVACVLPEGFVANQDDCDDLSADAHPGGTETCDGVDNDCNGSTDEPGAIGERTWWADADGDGYGDVQSSVFTCTQPAGYTDNPWDCDDTDKVVTTPITMFWVDFDGDGYGNPRYFTQACVQPEGYATNDLDCNDFDAALNPDQVWYADGDSDGYGDASASITACGDAPSGYVADSNDCDDGDANAWTLTSIDECDGYDNNCDGSIDGGLTVPTDYTTIADALEDAVDGDHICVAAGTYVGTVDFGGKNVSLIGIGGSSATILDGDADGSVITMASGETGLIKGVTITNGKYKAGAGLYLDGASLTMEDVIVDANECAAGASCWGVIYAEDSELTFTDVDVTNNTVGSRNATANGYTYGTIFVAASTLDWNGGVIEANELVSGPYSYNYLYGSALLALDSSVVHLTGVDILDNQANNASTTYGYNYALIYNEGSDIVIADATINGNVQNNTAGSYAYNYGLFYNTSFATLTFEDTEISENSVVSTSTGYAYAYYFLYNSNCETDFVRTSVSDNDLTGVYSGTSTNTAYAYYFIYNGGGKLTMVESDFTDNLQSATSNGAGYAYYGIYNSSGRFTMHDSTFTGHQQLGTSTGSSTGYAYYYLYNSSGSFEMTDSEMSGNTQHGTSASGSGYAYYNIYNSSGSFKMKDSVWADNTQYGEASGSGTAYAYYGVYNSSGRFSLDGSVWSGNTQQAESSSGTAYAYYGVYNSSGTMDLKQSIWADNTQRASTSGSAYVYYGVYVSGSSAAANFRNVIWSGNTMESTGTLYAPFYNSSGSLLFENVAFTGNTVDTDGTGYSGLVYALGTGYTSMVNSTVDNNSFSAGAGNYSNLYYASGTSTVESVEYSNFYNNGGTATYDFSLNGTGVTVTGSDGNVAYDPDYTSTTATDTVDWNLSLASTSYLIDAGDPNIEDPDGSTSDIGAYGGPGASW